VADPVSYADRLATDTSTKTLWREHRAEGIANCRDFWAEASRLKKFAARKQWPESRDANNRANDPNRRSARLTVPETSRVLAAFSGKQIMQRVEREYIPRNQDTARFAETLSRVDKAVCQACDGEQVDSAAFRDGPGIQGISWVRWFVDDWTRSTPQLRYETVPIWQMMWPSTRQINLSDRAWHRWGSWWPQGTVRARWPDAYDKIRLQMGQRQWSSIQQQTGQSSRIPWSGDIGNRPLPMQDVYDPKTRCFWIEREELREMETFWEVARPVDPSMSYELALELDKQRILAMQEAQAQDQQGGGNLGSEGGTSPMPTDPFETVEMTVDQLRDFRRARLAQFDEDVPDDAAARKQRMVYRYIYGCGDEILAEGDIEQGLFTFQSMAAEVIELEDRTLYISLLKDLEDAQKMVNYMMSALIRDIQVNPKGGIMVEQGLFRDKNEALTAWTAPGGVIEVQRGRLSGAGAAKPYELIPSPPGQYAGKLESMLAFYREAIPRLAGFNPAALGQLGSDIRRVSGEVIKQLTDATMTSNAERMDSLRLYRREGGRIFLAFARTLWEPEDLVQFIGESDAYDDVLDPTTGEPTGQQTFTIPPKDMWHEDAWKEIAIEEVAPSDSDLESFWSVVQTQVQLLQAPMPDTGQPLFQAEDWIKMFPKMPAALRQKMLARIKMQQQQFQQQKAQAQQQQEQDAAKEHAKEAVSINYKDLAVAAPDAADQALVLAGLRRDQSQGDGQGQGQPTSGQ
jgi:hypothetical protein